MAVSENVVYPYINPMVFMIIIPIFYGYFIGNIAYFQRCLVHGPPRGDH